MEALTVIELGRVQVLIERCLLHYMSHNEVVDALNRQASIDPTFTRIVWQKLEEQNQEFFKAYNLRLMVKDQIMQFNNLLEMQWKLMHQTHPAEMPLVPRSNGSDVPPLHFDSGSYATFPPEQKVSVALPNAHFNHNISQNTLLAQNSDMGMVQGMNGLNVGSDFIHALQDSNMSSSEQILRNLSVSDFAADFGDKNSFDMFFDDRFDQDDFCSE